MKPSTKNHLRSAICLLVVLLCGLLGWWLARDIKQSMAPKRRPPPPPPPSATAARIPREPASSIGRDHFQNNITVEVMASSRENQAILRLPSDDAYLDFLDALPASRVSLVDQLDRLRAVRLAYQNVADLDEMLSAENIKVYPAISRMPDRVMQGPGVQNGSMAFGDQVIHWLGLHGDRSHLGAGVKIAVLDSGILAHEAVSGLVKSIAIQPFPENLAETHGHGTAVASLIAGNHPMTPGVAPAAKLVSVRVCDEKGAADSFDVAAGILAAMDERARIINISMGSYEDSPLMAAAVSMAQNQGVVIVAAAGNDGQEDAAYPAAYPGVISVGAVDARGEQLDFSNFGNYLSLTAPGLQVNAAWPGNTYVRLSGTSVSAPLVTGAIAATMSPGTGIVMEASEAARLVMDFSDEAGIPGPDSQYGSGILNLGRVLSRNNPGLLDAAITDQRIFAADAYTNVLKITVQNRGTAILINTMVEISTVLGTRKLNTTTIPPGAIHTFSLPIPAQTSQPGEPFQVSTRVTSGNAGEDLTPSNNQRTDSFDLR